MTLDKSRCEICREPANRHMIVGKLVDVEIWHRVFNGADVSPSLANTPLIGVDTKKELGPLIKRPIIPAMTEGTEAPQYRRRAGE